MKILIAGSGSPFSAHEEFHWAHAIQKFLSDQGHQVDMFMLPIVQDPLLLPEQFMAYRLMNTDVSSDILITVGYPAFALKHSRKRTLLFSLSPHLHEWFNSEYGVISTHQYQYLRHSIEKAVRNCLSEAERVICGSEMLSSNLKDWDIKSGAFILDDTLDDVRYTELPDKVQWIVTETTLEPGERIDLLLDTVAFSTGKWKLAIFVPAASAVYYAALESRISKLNINERILIIDNAIPKGVFEKAAIYVNLRYQSIRIPESLVRAVKSETKIVTLTDSGALHEVMRENVNGWLLEPDAKKIAKFIDQTISDILGSEKILDGNHIPLYQIADIATVVKALVG